MPEYPLDNTAASAGAATEATLATVAGDTTSIDSKTPALGAAAAAASVPVVLASDQSAVPVRDGVQHLGTGGQVLAIGAASVRSTALAVGEHRISGSGDVWLRQGGNAVVATAGAGSSFLAAGAIESLWVTGAADGYVAIIRDGTMTGNVSVTQIR